MYMLAQYDNSCCVCLHTRAYTDGYMRRYLRWWRNSSDFGESNLCKFSRSKSTSIRCIYLLNQFWVGSERNCKNSLQGYQSQSRGVHITKQLITCLPPIDTARASVTKCNKIKSLRSSTVAYIIIYQFISAIVAIDKPITTGISSIPAHRLCNKSTATFNVQ